MIRALRFLWDLYIKVILGSIGVFAVISLALAQWAHIEFFAMYYHMLPIFIVIFMVVFSFNLTILYRNVALSFNCRRADFFWGSQAGFVLTALGSNAIVYLAGALPRLLGQAYYFREEGHFLNGAPIFIQPHMALFLLAASLLLQPAGAAAGCLYEKHKVLSTVFLVVSMLLCIAATALLMFIEDGTLDFGPTVMGGMLAVLAVLCAGCEVFFWRENLRTVVR